ncbi:hypothetical protein [Neobacillus mesonae]|uniref:hypothetical protein n=1 Tax=Neobacillus mesonae TaxID=1193713 RepID=UPI000AA02349|nr:hypothetical protein [Neobacillus mesonae]MED4202922.1 hypothetical protein [Neobacillus mesonae]
MDKQYEKLRYSDNSSMARDLKEIKKLGKEMEQEKTGKELKKEDGLTQDPKQ